MKNSISFIIPAYNCENYIEEAILSIYETNYRSGDEIVVVNDKSTDNTKNILLKIRSKIPIIIIENKINLGCPASRNIGIKKANNDLIFNLDSDNILHPNTVESLKRCLIDNHSDIASFSTIYFFINNINNITHKWVFPYKTLILEDIFSSNYTPAASGNYLYKKALALKIGMYDTKYGKGLHESWLFTIKALSQSAKMSILPKNHYYHRYSHNSLFMRERINSKLQEQILRDVANEYQEYFNNSTTKWFQDNKNWIDLIGTRDIELIGNKMGRKGYSKILKKHSLELLILAYKYNYLSRRTL